MPGTTMLIPIDQLINYYENPRHAIGSNEEDTLKKLFDSVGVQYMLNLAEDVQKNGLLGNQQIVAVFSEEMQKYIVYEGNRRIAVIKLLSDPDRFTFLDRASIERARRIGQQGNIPTEINCYVTDEAEAFFIMERLHSGEDKGRGTKQWTSREKEAFKVRQSHQKKVSFLIDFYCKKFFDDFDITTILPFTTIERIFGNREIKKKIGLEIANEQSFTPTRMRLIIDASTWIVQEATASGLSVTRLFNKARTIEDILIPWLDEYMLGKDMSAGGHTPAENPGLSDSGSVEAGVSSRETGTTGATDGQNIQGVGGAGTASGSDGSPNSGSNASAGGNRNTPYFFQGINYSALNPNDSDTHGISAVCRELQLFSDKRLVATFPIAATFLVRTVIEQSIIFYSKKHNIQGQNKLIWEDIKGINKLSSIINKYKTNLPNYITDASIRQYFTQLFGNYEDNVDPLNWVVHRPAEFQLDSRTLIELPRKGLLTIINFLIS